MKKKLFLGMLAAAAVTFTSCQKDEVLNSVPQDQPIEFGTYVGRGAQTKAESNISIDNLADLQGKSFGVYAYYTKNEDYGVTIMDPNFMANQKIEWNTDKWSYTPVKYWPNNDGEKVSFFAYAPYDENNGSGSNITALNFKINDTSKDPEVVYDVNSDYKEHIDVLYSNTDNKNKTKQTINDKVTFNFAHALSRIGFSAQILSDYVAKDQTGYPDQNEDDAKNQEINTAETTVTIKEIKLIGKFNKQGTLNLNTGDWTCVTVNPHEDFTIDATKLYNYQTSSSNTLKNKTSLNTEDGKLFNETSNKGTDKGYLMILPQNFDSNDNLLKIQVTYDVKTEDNHLAGGESNITNVITSAPFKINFLKGNAYNFNLQLGLTSVKFDATITDWATGADYAVNVPINTGTNL